MTGVATACARLGGRAITVRAIRPRRLPDRPKHWCADCTRAESRAKQMNVRPLHDRIVVRRVEEQEVLPGGIIIPDTALEKPQKALVLAVGTGIRVDGGEPVPLDVRVGDEVLLGKYSG